MPLPPLPANNTDRAWLKYTSLGIQHEMVFRLPSATSQATFITVATALANALKSFLAPTDSFSGLRHQDSGSTLSFPLAFTSIAGTGTPGTEKDNEAKFWALSGRSLQGYRCRLTFFPAVEDGDTGYRTAGSSTLLTAVQSLTPSLVAVDGQVVIWNNWLNKGYNAYWQRQLR